MYLIIHYTRTGDGRNDSHGHCSQSCSYTLKEDATKKIQTLQTLDKHITDRKSVNMEKVGLHYVPFNDFTLGISVLGEVQIIEVH